MPRLSLALTCAVASLLQANSVSAQSTIAPLASFGTNGWLAAGTSAFLTSTNTERGLAHNPVTGNLVLVSRAGGNHVRILGGATGADLGGFDTTGITGGTFAVNMAGVGDDGAIYVGNLSTSATANFKVYKWASEALGPTTPPSVAYDALSGTARTGDSFAVTGGALNPVKFAASGSSAVATNSNSNFVVGSLDGLNTSTAYLSIPGTNTASNDYRLALSFVDQNTLIGNQGTQARYTTFNATTATVTASIPLGGVAQRPLDYAVIGGIPCLAVIDTGSAMVSVFDLSVPAAPALLLTANNTAGTLIANTNATGSVQWGAISGNTATLYAMGTNHGIQAFQVVIDPPASARAYGTGCGTPALALSAVGAPVLPSTIQLQVDNIPLTASVGAYAFALGAIPSGVQIPGAAPGCLQYVQVLGTTFFVPTGSTFQLPQTYPGNAVYAGLRIHVQALVLDPPSTILASNGLRLYLKTF